MHRIARGWHIKDSARTSLVFKSLDTLRQGSSIDGWCARRRLYRQHFDFFFGVFVVLLVVVWWWLGRQTRQRWQRRPRIRVKEIFRYVRCWRWCRELHLMCVCACAITGAFLHRGARDGTRSIID